MVQRIILPQATEVLGVYTDTNSDNTAAANKAYVDANSGEVYYDESGSSSSYLTINGEDAVLSSELAGGVATSSLNIETTNRSGDGPLIVTYFNGVIASMPQYFLDEILSQPFTVTGVSLRNSVSATITINPAITPPETVLAGRRLVVGGTATTYTRIRDLLLGTNLVGSVANNAQNRPTLTINNISGSGGGGSFSTVNAVWTSTLMATKAAQSAPGVPVPSGITILLIAMSNPGTLTAFTVSLNGVALPNPYTPTGSFPDYQLVIPQADVPNAALTAASVTVTLLSTQFNIGANALINTQPTTFTTVLSAQYTDTLLPFWVTTSDITYSYTNSAAITAFNGTITPAGGTALLATGVSGSFTNQPAAGFTIGGNATGNGSNGGATGTIVNLSGTIDAIPTYTPAFYAQTSTNTPPVFTTTSTATQGAAIGSIINYPAATLGTQYNWICTQVPLAQLILVTPVGNGVLIPDIGGAPTPVTQTIGGQTFNVYGWTRLSVGVQSVLQIVAAS